MTGHRTIEEERLVLQTKLDGQKTSAERNRLGQFATKTSVALDMLSYSKRLLKGNSKVRFLDPAFGTGSFFSALLKTFSKKQILAAEGFEIDPHYGSPATKLWNGSRLKLHMRDFTHTTVPATKQDRFNLIICNPPYVRHHHISNPEKIRMQYNVKNGLGIHLSGLAGLYCYFLLLTHNWMADNGIAGWLIPSEFMDVNYGNALKQYLLNNVSLIRIHRFDPRDVQFDDALVSSAIVFFSRTKPTEEHEIECTFGGTFARPRLSTHFSSAQLRQDTKWTRIFSTNVRKKTSSLSLGDLFTIKRGLATGDNSFFILPKESIEDLKLPFKFFKPILPSPRCLQSDEVRADERGIPAISQRLFLLDCDLPEEEIKSDYPNLWKYLKAGKERGIQDGYLCQHREPWYSQEQRPPSLFLCTYMGRSGTKKGREFRFILNHSKATATNVYLIMYPKESLLKKLHDEPSLAGRLWKALNQISSHSLLDEGRVYGGGLHKLEPRELANVSIDEILPGLPELNEGRTTQFKLFADAVA